jgi:hypothetical protein
MPNDLPTTAQLNKLSDLLRGPVAKTLGEPVNDVTLHITCIPVPEDPNGASKLRFEILVRGEPLSTEREERVVQILKKKV